MKKFLFLALLATSFSFASTTETVKETVKENADKIITESAKGLNTTYTDSKSGVTAVYDDGKGAISTVYNDMKSLAPDIKSALVSIAEGLKTTSEKVWDILVKQQLVFSLSYLVLFISSLFLWFQFKKQYNLLQTDLDEDNNIKDKNILFTVLLALLAITDSVVSGLHMVDMITGFVNPEYGALKNIIEVASTLK